MADAATIAEQVVGFYDGDQTKIANFCIDLLTAVGLHEDADAAWDLLLGGTDRTISRDEHILVDATLESIGDNAKVAKQIVQDLLGDAGATDAEQTEAWYTLWGEEGAPSEAVPMRPASTNRREAMVRLVVDYENDAAQWWDNGGQELWFGIAGGDEEVIVDDAVADAWLDEAQRLPGWDDGPEYAPYPVVVTTAAKRREAMREAASEELHGFRLGPLFEEARSWIPDDATWEDIEDYSGEWDEGVEAMVFEVSPGASGIYQVKDAADLFDVVITPDDEEYDGGWELVEEAADRISEDLTDAGHAAGLPGHFYFGHTEGGGDYGLMYGVSFDDLPNVVVPARESGWR